MNKISAIIIAGNEEKNIVDCLKSVSWADEIIVVDSESTDKTVELAKTVTPKVYTKRWEGYAKQKAYALSLAQNEWVLSLDADERATPELKDEILSGELNNYDGYKIPRINYFLGRRILYCGWGTDKQLRLFRKSKSAVTNRLVHESFEVDGIVGLLKNGIEHYSYRSIRDAMVKNNIYSSLEAQEKYKRKKVTPLSFILHPLAAFLQSYIVKQGFRDGPQGLIISILHAVTNVQTYMKMWELKKNEQEAG